MGQLIIFYGLAALITLCSAMVVISRNPIVAAVYLVVDLFLLAGVFAIMGAHFVAAIQILVYAGAIVVLFIFVIMLLNLGPIEGKAIRMSVMDYAMAGLTVVAFMIVAGMLATGEPLGMQGLWTEAAIEAKGGNTRAVGLVLFTKYLWPFELASMLILLAIIASIVIAKKDKADPGVRNKRRLVNGNR